jgi:imidazolonepropionase-like amidohydrolase
VWPSKKTHRLATHLCFWLLITFPAVWAETWVQAGQYYDGQSDQLNPAATIVVEADKIQRILPGHPEPPAQALVVDLKGSTVLPGFIDCHVHLSGEFNPALYINRFKWDSADFAVRSTVYARKTLEAGFTTVRDLGDTSPGFSVVLALKKAIDDGTIEGPRIVAAGKSLATIGGHADPTNGTGSQYSTDFTVPDGAQGLDPGAYFWTVVPLDANGEPVGQPSQDTFQTPGWTSAGVAIEEDS